MIKLSTLAIFFQLSLIVKSEYKSEVIHIKCQTMLKLSLQFTLKSIYQNWIAKTFDTNGRTLAKLEISQLQINIK